MRMLKIVIIIISAIFLSNCTDSTEVVVVYTSVDQVFSEPILKDFEQETGIKVKAVYDAEETKSTGVLNRLIAEKDNPQCDVFWSGDPVRTIILQNKGITAAYHSPIADGISEVYRDKDYHWIGFSARARVLLYNKKLIDESEVPQGIFDLTNDKYRGRFGIANPLFGTTTFHMAALFTVLGDEKAKQLLDSLQLNGLVIATSNGDIKRRVLSGEIACGLTDTDDAFEALKESDNVDLVFLDQKGIGSLIIPNTVNMINGSRNVDNAKVLIDYLLSKQTEAKLAKSCAQMPLHKGVKLPEGVFSLDHIVPMKVDYRKTAKKLEEIQDYLKRWSEN
ncbi:MAG: extracellular solute-binding protein [Bacteroidales bacterium]|nr:extracellular solute-binding protein [Bacteroidales bacterium]